jgi:hypothetical protein
MKIVKVLHHCKKMKMLLEEQKKKEEEEEKKEEKQPENTETKSQQKASGFILLSHCSSVLFYSRSRISLKASFVLIQKRIETSTTLKSIEK